eukprot:CAMPEP_0172323230 /NCGR_PEP_ID=MMETSP1058-20130122/48215_1 /TAXON_ID=83371 /ORGANISM="Detonula confervacea, Strain CCMP 353" /LENGTH=320 /DNA_ID=CAMNT_0013039183 /DNA_START=46 /DNA_END=1008 /DNA_ORIENTATION=-
MASPSSSAAASKAASARMRHLSSTSSSSDITNDNNDISTAKPLFPPKRVLLLRHGQAIHNPRAEAARENGCSFEKFLSLMEEDDSFDAALTELGENQARDAGRQGHVRHALRNVEMIVSSPMSRALNTADLVHPVSTKASMPRRVAIEDWREINGKLLNAQRLPRSALEQKFPNWNFGEIPALDESWTEELESRDACSERGYRGLLWMMQQREQNILLACHGGILNYTMNTHSKVVLVDGRKVHSEKQRCITKRFGNCEMREFIMTVWDFDDYPTEETTELLDVQKNGEIMQPVITLEEVTMEMEESYTLSDDEEKVEMT